MANYDNKLGEWFKLVEEQEKELKAKKSTDDSQPLEEAKPIVEQEPTPEKAYDQGPGTEAPSAATATIDDEQEVADSRPADRTEPETADRPPARKETSETRPELFDEHDVEQVEDFLAFLNRTRDDAADGLDDESYIDPEDQGTLNLAEGTGEPRPIPSDQMRRAEPVIEDEPPIEMPPSRRPIRPVAPVTPPQEAQPEPQAQPPVPPAPAADSVEEKWDRVPHHLQTLFAGTENEVAQHSYKRFRETRGTLIQRLLDPVISLEEAARILNVCPTTVRRYTNRGVLKHLRTAGNQRRFRLSDVLSFMDERTAGPSKAAPSDNEEQ